MKRVRGLEEPEELLLECWGEVALQLPDATSLLNLTVVCWAFYTGLEPVILEWLLKHTNRVDDYAFGTAYMYAAKIRGSLRLDLVHRFLYLFHQSDLYIQWRKGFNEHEVCEPADRHATVGYCWWVDPVQRHAVPLGEMEPIWIQLNDECRDMARDALKEQKPLAWKVLDRHLDCQWDGWRDVMWEILGMRITRGPAHQKVPLQELVLGNHLICPMERTSDQCIRLYMADRRSREENEQIVIRTYCAYQCYNQLHQEITELCDTKRPSHTREAATSDSDEGNSVQENEEENDTAPPQYRCSDPGVHTDTKGECEYCEKSICKKCENECAGCDRQCCYECMRYNCDFMLCDGCHEYAFCEVCYKDREDPIVDWDERWCFKCKPKKATSSSGATSSSSSHVSENSITSTSDDDDST